MMTIRFFSYLDSRLIKNTPYFIGLLLCLLGSLFVFNNINPNPYLATDFGQWIMFSRYYLGQSTPNYIDPRSAHPLFAIILAVFTIIDGDSVHAIVVLASFFYLLFLLSLFAVALELFHDALVADIVVALAGFGQYIYLNMTLGLLAQLGALICFNIGFYAILIIDRDLSKYKGWIILGLSCLLVPFVHIPSAPIYFLCVFSCLYFVFFRNKRKLSFLIIMSIKFLLPSLAIFLVYFYFYRDVIVEYAVNPASYYRSGIRNFIGMLTINNWLTAFGILSVVCVLLLSVYFPRKQKIQGNEFLVIIIFSSPLAFMCICYLFHVGTDYARFVYYLMAPAIFAQVFVFRSILQSSVTIEQSKSRFIDLKPFVRSVSVIIFACIYVGNTVFTLSYFPKMIYSLEMKYSSSLLGVVSWLKNKPIIGSVFAPSRPEGTWIEGLTGMTTIFPEEFWYINRPGMIDRSFFANIISTGVTTSADNGYIYIRNQEHPRGISFNPNVSIYNSGAYVNIITFQDDLITIAMITDAGKVDLNLGKDFFLVKETVIVNNNAQLNISLDYIDLYSSALKIKKDINIEKDLGVARISYKFQALNNLKIDSILFQFADVYEISDEEVVQKSFVNFVEIRDRSAMIYRKDMLGNPIVANMSFSSNMLIGQFLSNYAINKPYLKLLFESRNKEDEIIEFAVFGNPSGRFQKDLRTFNLHDILLAYQVKYIVINEMDVYTNAVYNFYKFKRVYFNQNYSIYEVP